ncbi:MAG TPA: hypothetical protein VJU79_10800, partial [Candidatus Dormibacteraeota bacterium]|nr:hypothetical protein [Candidatus Dormibacteraeota bacterium]
MLRRRRLLWAACASALLLGVCGIALADVIPGQIGPALGITPSGRQLHPVGRLTQVGNFPIGSALTPDGRFIWVVDAGHGSNDVRVMNVATGQVVQTLPLPGAGGGIVFAPDGKHAYVSGTPKGSSPTLGPTKGNEGDVIHVFSVNRNTGRGIELNPFVLPQSTGGSARTNSATLLSGPGTAYPEGLAISDNGRWLVAALNQADLAAIVEIPRRRMRLVSVGAYPMGAAFDHHGRAYVSNEYDGTVSVIDPVRAQLLKVITGLGLPEGDRNSHPEGMTADPVREAIYVAVTNRDRVATINTKTLTVTDRISVGRQEGVGTAPVAVATDPLGITLYASDSGEDAVAAISLTKRPKPGATVTPKRLVVVPTIKRLARFRTLSLRAKRMLARTHGKGRRAAARKRYTRTIKALRKQYLRGPSKIACQGPTRRRESAYVKSVLAALDLKPAKQRKRALVRAKRRVPRFALCTALPGYIPNLPRGTLIGRLPTGAYPTSVNITSNRQTMLWVAAKGAGTGPNPGFTSTGDTSPDGPPDQSPYGSYLLNLLLGTVGTLPAPSDQQM